MSKRTTIDASEASAERLRIASRAGAEEIHPPAQEQEVKRRMRNVADVGKDAARWGRGRKRGQIGLVRPDEVGREAVVYRPATHGRFDGPNFVFPETWVAQAVEAQQSAGNQNHREDSDMENREGGAERRAGGRPRYLGHRSGNCTDRSPGRRIAGIATLPLAPKDCVPGAGKRGNHRPPE